MKKIINYMLIFVSNITFSSYNSFQALEYSRKKVQEVRSTNSPDQRESSLKDCMLLFEKMADLKEMQEKERADLIERKEQMRALIFKGINLVASLEAQGMSNDQAADISFQSEDHKQLMKIGKSFSNYNDFVNLILEIKKEEEKKASKK